MMGNVHEEILIVTRLGELLDRVKDADFILDAEILEQLCIGDPVDPGLESSHIDRHTVGLFMIQSGKQALA